MKKTSVAKQKPVDWEAECERTRQAGNKLSDEARRQLKDKALQIIYSTDAQATTRSR